MATKLKVLLQRVEAKDYQDIAALIKAGVSLERGLAAAREMFGHSFQPSESLKALVYFEGGDLDSLTHTNREILIKAVNAVRKLPKVKIMGRDLWAYPAPVWPPEKIRSWQLRGTAIMWVNKPRRKSVRPGFPTGRLSSSPSPLVVYSILHVWWATRMSPS